MRSSSLRRPQLSKIKIAIIFATMLLVSLWGVTSALRAHNSWDRERTLPFVAQAKLGYKPADIVKTGEFSETVVEEAVGKTAVYGANQMDRGPSGATILFRSQRPDSGLDPVWAHRGWWLGEPEQKKAVINGRPVQIDVNLDKGLSKGKSYRQIWLKASWTKENIEYQMLTVNVSMDDFVKMANSVTTE